MSRTRITLQDLIDRGFNPAGWQVTVDGSGNFVLTAPPSAGGGDGIGIYGLDDGIALGTGSWIDWQGAGVTATISGTVLTITIPGGGGGGGGGNIGVYGLDEGIPLGTGSWINIRGSGVEATISGTTLSIFVPGESVDQIGVYGLDNGVLLGTGTWIDFGDDLNPSISGSTIRLDVTHPPFPEEVVGVYGLDEGIPLGTGSWVNFRGSGVEATISGTTLSIFIPGESTDQIGVYGLDNGVLLGTGTWLDFGNDLNPSISGSTIRLDVTHPSFPEEVIGVYGLNEGTPLGTGSWIDWSGAGVTATLSGTVLTVNIPGGGGGGGANLGVYGLDEGIPLGTGSWIDWRGAGVTATVSGTVLTVTIPGGGGGGGGGGLGIMAWDEGAPLQTGSVMNFVGSGVEATISGSVINVEIDGPTLKDAGQLPTDSNYIATITVADNWDYIDSGDSSGEWLDPTYAIDSNLTTFAAGQALNDECWIVFDMGSVLSIDAVRVYNDSASSDLPTDYVKIYLSYTGTFGGEETLAAYWETPPAYVAGWTNYVFDQADQSYVSPISGRYIKLLGYKGSSNWWRMYSVSVRLAGSQSFANIPFGVTIDGYVSGSVVESHEQLSYLKQPVVMFTELGLDRFVLYDPEGVQFLDSDDIPGFSVIVTGNYVKTLWSV